MFRLSIFAFFILFASLSLASDIENPLQYRQDNNTSTTTLSPSASPRPSSSPSASLSSISTSPSVGIQTTDSTASTSSDAATTSLQGAIKTSPIISTTQVQSRLSTDSKSSTSKDGSSQTTSSSTTPTGSVTQTIVTTIVSTSGSVTLSMTSTSSKVIAAALASSTSSGAARLDGSNGGSGSSGLSSKSKSVIGGVVGGVGGAILLGGLAIVFLRVWGKNRRSHGVHNDSMDLQPGQEKSSSVSGHSPFVTIYLGSISQPRASQYGFQLLEIENSIVSGFYELSSLCPSSYNSGYLSGTPSPLAPINPNACLRFSLQKVQMASRGQTSSDTSKYSHKRATQNPLLQCKPSKEEDRKRQVFLKKVRQASDDKKWETRSEQILRKDFIARQKEWELDQARSAPEFPQALDDDEHEAESNLKEVEMADQILSHENQEFEALVSSMQVNADQGDHHQQKTMSDYGSDEEEYDRLFMEVISRQGSAKRSTETAGDSAPERDQEMDFSMG
ncbi:MAG: hypothetical protein ASARMPRED_001755 [Alectoria sarmentosa]|nr:MAG: hypothetical protein ASARMPRED_001755 [Alectoria sarmentosa]